MNAGASGLSQAGPEIITTQDHNLVMFYELYGRTKRADRMRAARNLTHHAHIGALRMFTSQRAYVCWGLTDGLAATSVR
jgi:hypothetical protein